VERVVDAPRFRESELVYDGGEDLGDGEGAFTFRGEFWVSDRAF